MSFTTPLADPSLSMQQAQSARIDATARLGEAGKMNDAAVDEAAQEFEAMFLAQMLQPMFEGMEPNPLFGGGQGEKIFNSMMVEEYGKAIAAGGGVGIADTVKAAMLELQEAK